jgi:uncharacterized protein
MVAWISNVVLLGFDVAFFVLTRRAARTRVPRAVLVAGLLLGPVVAAVAITLLAPFIDHWTLFAPMQSVTWALFVHLPLQLLVVAAFGGTGIPAVLRAVCVAGAIALVGVGADAALVEPHALDVTRVDVDGPGVRIVLVTDLQTERIGDYETGVIARIRALEPDLVLYGGDYVQTWDDAVFDQEAAKLHDLLGTLAPRLGSVAVEGDVDRHDWGRIFAGLPVEVVHESQTFTFGPVAVTALTPGDSRSENPPVPKLASWHVVLGHSPDFALSLPPADLLLAGHTHGGQIVLPLIGPLLTLTKVPRDEASGLSVLTNGSRLCVSRGVGLERMDAPRIRFLCHPELVVIDAGARSAGP